MLKKLIEWTEGDVARGRKLVLIGTIFFYLLITGTLFIYGMYIGLIDNSLINLFTVFTGLVFTIYGFYTGTSADKSTKIADQAADIILTKMKEMGEKKWHL